MQRRPEKAKAYDEPLPCRPPLHTKMIFSLCKLGNILILFNSKQSKEAGRAFKSKYDHLI